MRTTIATFLLACLATAAQAQTTTETIYLSGHDADDAVQWNFTVSGGMKAGKKSRIAVPSCWEQQGFGEYTYGRYYKKEGGRPSTETGRYSRTFNVPAAWQGRKVEVVFEGVMTDATVSVNGLPAGDTHRGGFTAFGYDISDKLRYGKRNTIEVDVKKHSDDKSVNSAERRADWWLFGGIYRPVYLRALPAAHIAHTAIDARADGTLRMAIETVGAAEGCSLRTVIEGIDEQTQPLSTPTDGQSIVESSWKGIRPWDTEHPTLYTMHLYLIAPDGTTLHETSQRMGFRTIEFRHRDGFYLNGRKLRIKGVNRHCFYPETGRATSKRLDTEDVRMVKAMNANAIRSHYPPDAHLLDICDSLGVLYFDELPGWQNSYSTATGSRILREMLRHDANHPCIFAWGNGNEGGFNTALDPLFARHDLQQRHVVHPWALFDGVDAHHYPAYQTGVARLHNGYNVFMPTEFLHSQYDKGAGASLDEYWASWSQNPLFAGGFIWALIDEGVCRTDKGGKIDTDGTNAPDGIVGPHREREGSWYTIRDVWSPIQIAPMTVTPRFDGRINITNGFLFSRLSECRMTYEVKALASPLAGGNGRTVAMGTVSLPDIGSGESGTAHFTVPKDFSDGDVLQLTAFDRNGDTINIWTYPMRYADEYFARQQTLAKPIENNPDAKATVSANEDSKTIALTAAGVCATFSTEGGRLLSVVSNGDTIPLTDGPLPVGMKMRLKGMASRQDGRDAVIVMRYTGAADSIVWRMTPQGLLGMDALILNKRDGGGFDGAFFDADVRNLGFTFSYPESLCKGMTWMGRGPYRVWRNRERGTLYNVWTKDYNNTVTGQSETRLVYPEFKGYHANTYWARMESDSAPFTVYSETDGLYLRMFTPEEPTGSDGKRQQTMQPFPEGDISFLLEIPGMRSYKPIEQLGPQAQPSHIRINKGDEGLRVKLWFDFMK